MPFLKHHGPKSLKNHYTCAKMAPTTIGQDFACRSRSESRANPNIIDMRQTLRTQWFCEEMVSPEAFQDGKIEPKPLFLKRLSDAEKISVRANFDTPESVMF